jgi:4-amino-4-deoxy-L-arabinose transferase-like glycosyltransferase
LVRAASKSGGGADRLPAGGRSVVPLLAAIVLGALALRAIHLVSVQRETYFRDPSVTPDSSYTNAWAADPAFPGHAEAYYVAPLYMEGLRLLYALIGPAPATARWLQIVVGSLNPLLLYWLVTRLRPGRAALLAAILGAVYPVIIFYEATTTKEAIVPVVVLGMLAGLLWADGAGGGRARRWLLAGAGVGLVALLRPNLLVFPPLVVGVILLSRRGGLGLRRRVLCGAAFAAGVAVAVAPVTIRNLVVAGERVLVSNSGGFVFYLSNRAGAGATWTKVPDVRDDIAGEAEDSKRVAESALGRSLRPSEVSAYFFRRGWEDLRRNWAEAAGRAGERLLLVFNAIEVPNAEHFYFARQFSPVLKLPLPGFGLLLPWAALGAWASRRNRPGTSLIHLYTLCNVAGLLAFCVTDRYRLLLAPCVIPFAGIGLDRALQAIGQRDRRGMLGAMAVGAGGYVLAWLPVAPHLKRDLHVPVQAAAQCERMARQPRKALALLEPSLASRQGMPETAILAAQCHLDLADPATARKLIEGELAANDGRFELHLLYAQTSAALRDLEAAERGLRKAAELSPGEPVVAHELARLRKAQGRRAEAAAILEEAIGRHPKAVVLYVELTALQASQGQLDRARQTVERGLGQAPRHAGLLELRSRLEKAAGR